MGLTSLRCLSHFPSGTSPQPSLNFFSVLTLALPGPRHSSCPLKFPPTSSSLHLMGLACCMLSHFSCVRLFATLWTIARQAPLSMGFSRQDILEWVAIPFFRRSSRPEDRTRVSYIFTASPPRKSPKTGRGGSPKGKDLSRCFTGGCVNNSCRRKAALTHPGYYTVVFTRSLPFWTHLCYVERGSLQIMLVLISAPRYTLPIGGAGGRLEAELSVVFL